MSSKNDHTLLEKVQKAGISAGLATGLWVGFKDSSMQATFNVRGSDYPAYVVIAVIGASASMVTTMVSDAFIAHIPKNKKAMHLESLFIHVATSAVLYGGIPKILSSDFNMSEARQFAIIGVGVEVVSTMISDKMIELERDLSFII